MAMPTPAMAPVANQIYRKPELVSAYAVEEWSNVQGWSLTLCSTQLNLPMMMEMYANMMQYPATSLYVSPSIVLAVSSMML